MNGQHALKITNGWCLFVLRNIGMLLSSQNIYLQDLIHKTANIVMHVCELMKSWEIYMHYKLQ